MKKFIFIACGVFICLLAFVSCKKTDYVSYNVNFDIEYPDTTVTCDSIFNLEYEVGVLASWFKSHPEPEIKTAGQMSMLVIDRTILYGSMNPMKINYCQIVENPVDDETENDEEDVSVNDSISDMYENIDNKELLKTYKVITKIMEENDLTMDTSFQNVQNWLSNKICNQLQNE